MKGLFAGISTVDIQFYVNEFPDSNTKNKTLSTRVDIGGPATNAAVTFAMLGGKAKLVTMIGQHEFRDYMLNKLSEYKIEVTDTIRDIKRYTQFSVIISSIRSGDRTIFESPLLKEQRKANAISIQDFDVCLVDGYLDETAKEITSIARDSGIITVMDGGSWKEGMDKYLKNIDYAVCSSDFFPPECKTHIEVISFLHDYGIKNIAITRGDKSIVVFTNGRRSEINIKKVNAIDTLGAGDVFHGALCYFLPGDYNFVSALKKASDIATESCKYHGAHAWSTEFFKKQSEL